MLYALTKVEIHAKVTWFEFQPEKKEAARARVTLTNSTKFKFTILQRVLTSTILSSNFFHRPDTRWGV